MGLSYFDKPTRPISSVHIRTEQRNGKKTITLIEGLAGDLDLNKIAKALRRTFKTSACVLTDDFQNHYIKLAGDHRVVVKDFLIRYKIWEYPDDPIKTHGV